MLALFNFTGTAASVTFTVPPSSALLDGGSVPPHSSSTAALPGWNDTLGLSVQWSSQSAAVQVGAPSASASAVSSARSGSFTLVAHANGATAAAWPTADIASAFIAAQRAQPFATVLQVLQQTLILVNTRSDSVQMSIPGQLSVALPPGTTNAFAATWERHDLSIDVRLSNVPNPIVAVVPTTAQGPASGQIMGDILYVAVIPATRQVQLSIWASATAAQAAAECSKSSINASPPSLPVLAQLNSFPVIAQFFNGTNTGNGATAEFYENETDREVPCGALRGPLCANDGSGCVLSADIDSASGAVGLTVQASSIVSVVVNFKDVDNPSVQAEAVFDTNAQVPVVALSSNGLLVLVLTPDDFIAAVFRDTQAAAKYADAVAAANIDAIPVPPVFDGGGSGGGGSDKASTKIIAGMRRPLFIGVMSISSVVFVFVVVWLALVLRRQVGK